MPPEDDHEALAGESTDCDAYLLLRELEIALRELVITEFASLGDLRWWKRRVPNDVQETATRGQQYEKTTRWLDASTYHQIYYTDFGDIRKIVTSRTNWQDVFSKIFYNKEQLIADLQSLEPIRNTIAHSRTPSRSALHVLTAVHNKVKSSVGGNRWRSLIQQQTVVQAAVVIPEMLSVLSEATEALRASKTIDITEVVHAHEQWWWDSDVLGGQLDNTDRVIRLLSEYNALPRGRGQGHILETWIRKNELVELVEAAASELQAIVTTHAR